MDFLTELEIIESELTDRTAGLPTTMDNLQERLDRAMQFKAEGNSALTPAMVVLRLISAAYKAGAVDSLCAAPQAVANAGWRAALKCHAERGMAGWSTHKGQYLRDAYTRLPIEPTADDGTRNILKCANRELRYAWSEINTLLGNEAAKGNYISVFHAWIATGTALAAGDTNAAQDLLRQANDALQYAWLGVNNIVGNDVARDRYISIYYAWQTVETEIAAQSSSTARSQPDSSNAGEMINTGLAGSA